MFLKEDIDDRADVQCDLDSSNDESVYSNYHESSFGSSESEQEVQYLETK